LAAVAVHDPDGGLRRRRGEHDPGLGGHPVRGAVHASKARSPRRPCKVGDELGLIDGDILEIGADVQQVARAVLARMLARGGSELVTVVLGAMPRRTCSTGSRAGWPRHHPEVEVVGYEGGQPRWHAIIGVE
jgi:uncharacterized protein